MASTKKIFDSVDNSRRSFLTKGLTITALGIFLSPLQKAFGNTQSFLIDNAVTLGKRIKGMTLGDRLILNTKTKVVHFPCNKIYSEYQDIEIKNQKTIPLTSWEAQVKTPFHFAKKKSGITLEILALQKLSTGINDKSLNAAIRTIALAFTAAYNDSNGKSFNQFNFRLHELLAQMIALNGSIPVIARWKTFQMATGKINYDSLDVKKPLPPRVKWIKTKIEFDKKISFLLENKTGLHDKLNTRINAYKIV